MIADDKAGLERIAQANRDYTKVVGDMKVRTLLANNRDVLWHNPATGRRVLLSFKGFALPVEAGTPILDVTTGTEAMLDASSRLQAKASHAYLLGI